MLDTTLASADQVSIEIDSLSNAESGADTETITGDSLIPREN